MIYYNSIIKKKGGICIMMIDPKLVKFESTNDIVDYVTKGLPPTNKQFNELMEAVKNPVCYDDDVPLPGQRVIICQEDVIDWYNNDTVNAEIIEILNRIHHNRIVARNIAIGVGVAVAVGAVAVACKK